jgi:CysZ protein
MAPGVGKVFVKSILITLVVLIGFVVLVTFIAKHMAPLLENQDYAFYVPWIAGIGSFMIAWLLFPGIMPFIAGFFSNDIIEVIERQDYPPVIMNPNSFFSDLIFDTKFALKALLFNLLVLPLYLIPVINLLLFFSLNGYLLGKQFYMAAARRHVDDLKVSALGTKYSRAIFWAGVLIAFLATIPLINLIIPFWGVALMTHLFHLSND